MGLIKALSGAVGGALADQWKEFFYCDAIPVDTLVIKGSKRTTSRTTNTKGNDNIISNGSAIAVADGQAMAIVEQGRVVEFCAEPGEFVWDKSTEPSIFAGSLGKSILETFKIMGRRVAFGGDTAKDQRVYYFNLREITDNKFGTANPVPFKIIINEQLGFKMSVDLKMNGVYSYKLEDPILFYTNVAGNVAYEYKRSEIDAMLRGELIQALQPALAVLSANGVSYDQIPAHVDELTAALNEALKESWGKRGIVVYSMNIGVPSIPEKQRDKLLEWEETSMTINPNVGAARMVGGMTDAMKAAAANEGGAMNGFIGLGMVNNLGGQQVAALYEQGKQQPVAQQTPATAGQWKCPVCGSLEEDAFCGKCGAARPSERFCYKCGAKITRPDAAFCTKCGAKLDD